MAVAEFTLERGVTRVWQVRSTFPWMKIHPFSLNQEFVSPGDTVPLGHKYKCQKHARVTHNLLPEFEHFETNHRQIVASIFSPTCTPASSPPLVRQHLLPHLYASIFSPTCTPASSHPLVRQHLLPHLYASIFSPTCTPASSPPLVRQHLLPHLYAS